MSGIPGAPTLTQRLFVGLQQVLPQHLMSRGMHALAGSRFPPLRSLLIRGFLAGYRPNLAEAERPDPGSYASFNDFFTRALAPGARPLDLDPQALISPVDGMVSQLGAIEGTQLLQAKGHHYSLEALLDGSEWAARFVGGSFATVYLAPHNYHRIHAPLAGTLKAAWYVPGSLFSVNATTARAVPGLFARNERVCCVLEDSETGQCVALVLVGALMVGSMTTVWHGQITPAKVRRRRELPLTDLSAPLQLAKGAELGRFNMGSTVILLLPPGSVQWLPGLEPGSPVQMGQMLARLQGGL